MEGFKTKVKDTKNVETQTKNQDVSSRKRICLRNPNKFRRHSLISTLNIDISENYFSQDIVLLLEQQKLVSVENYLFFVKFI